MSFEHVLWLGGGPGAGKTSIARAIAYRFDLRLYVIDHRMFSHLVRLPAHPFHELSLDERWVEPEPEQMAEWFIETSRDRFALVLEDLAALPTTPRVVVEGPQLLPSFVAPYAASRVHAVYLMPNPELQQATVAGRGAHSQTSNPQRARTKSARRNALLAQRTETEAAEHAFAVFPVDRTLAEMTDLVTAHWARLLADRPRVPRGPLRRRENEVVVTQVRLYRASGEAPPGDPPVPFACECDTPGCDALVELTLAAYEASGACAPGH